MALTLNRTKPSAASDPVPDAHADWPLNYLDETSIDYIPEELRGLARDGRPFYRRDPEDDRKAMIDAAASKHGAHVVNYGPGHPKNPEVRRASVLEPTKSEPDMQAWLHIQALARARMIFNAEQQNREQVAPDRRALHLRELRRVRPPPTMASVAIISRTLPDGRDIKTCAKCFATGAPGRVEDDAEADRAWCLARRVGARLPRRAAGAGVLTWAGTSGPGPGTRTAPGPRRLRPACPQHGPAPDPPPARRGRLDRRRVPAPIASGDPAPRETPTPAYRRGRGVARGAIATRRTSRGRPTHRCDRSPRAEWLLPSIAPLRVPPGKGR